VAVLVAEIQPASSIKEISMTAPEQLQSIMGQNAVDAEGSKVGRVGQIYLDDRTGQPQWVTVSTGMFGTKESFAPLYGSRVEGDQLVLAVSKNLVKDAPNVENDGHLEDSEVDALFAHYNGYLGEQSQTTTGNAEYAGGSADNAEYAGSQGHDTSGPNTDDAMTRSEERLHVGTEQVETGRARLRKYIVTENVTTTVPVSHEEVRIEREPITEANRAQAMAGGDLTEEEHEVTLHAERPVVSKETVPVERVRLATETVSEQQTVSEQVRKEQIDQVGVDTDTDTNRR
jgi:uncharacterized protein (TIGR02271 family)